MFKISKRVWVWMFQFLIGRLKTGEDVNKIKREILFQFLIGRLKTGEYLVLYFTTINKFQFLIGRLKTQGLFRHHHPKLVVSIPYR